MIFRVCKKDGLKVTQHRSGQSAYSVFELSKSLYPWMLENQNQKTVRMNDSLALPLATASNRSSSYLINKTTTSLPEHWISQQKFIITLRQIN